MNTSQMRYRSARPSRATLTVALRGALLLALSSLPATNALAGPDYGVLDPTFGAGGIATFCVGSHEGCFTQTNGMTVQADGRILLAGSAPHGAGGSDWLFARLESGGSLDHTFNGKGWLDISVGPGTTKQSAASKAVVRPDGSILGVGYANDLATGGAYHDVEMISLNADGSFDTTFGNGTGKKMISFGVPSTGMAMGLQKDGKPIVAGVEDQSGSGGSSQQLVVLRERVPGGFDPAFATSGIFSLPATGDQTGTPGAVTFFGTEPLVGYYDAGGNVQIMELHSNGTLDTDFGSGTGIREVQLSGVQAASAPKRLLVVPNLAGKVKFAGVFQGINGKSYVFRLQTSGQLDGGGSDSFGAGGHVTVDFPVADIAWSPTGAIFAVAESGTGSLKLARIDSGGNQSTVNIRYPGTDVKATQMAVQSDGRIVIAGSLDGQAVVTRVHGDPVADLQPSPISCPSVTNAALSHSYLCKPTISGMTQDVFVPFTATPGSSVSVGLGFFREGENVTISNLSAPTHGTSTTSTVVLGGQPGPSEAPWDIRGPRTTVTFTVTTQ